MKQIPELNAFKRRIVLMEEAHSLASGRRADLETLRKYMLTAVADFTIIGEVAFWMQRAYYETLDFRKSVRFIFNGPCLRAEVTGEYVGDQKFDISFGFGMFLALDDLLLRVSSNRDFFSIDHRLNRYGEVQAAHLWTGCDCRIFYGCSGLRPKARFFDYSHVIHYEGDLINGSWLYAVCSSFPMDPERRKLADKLFQLGVVWLLTHENSHYFNFHLDLLYNPDFASELEGLGLVNLALMTEWQADRDAAKGIFSMAFNSHHLDALPPYAKDNLSAWLARFLAIGVAAPLLIFHNNRLNQSTDDVRWENHLPIHTRFVIMLETWVDTLRTTDFEQVRKIDPKLTPGAFLVAFFSGFVSDLQTLSHIFSREANHNNVLESWTPGQMPRFAPQKNLEVVDHESDEPLITAMLIRTLCSDIIPVQPFPEAQELQVRELEEIWFGDYRRRIVPFRQTMDELTKRLIESDSESTEGFHALIEQRKKRENYDEEMAKTREEMLENLRKKRQLEDDL